MKTLQTSATYHKIIRYYEEAGLDYQTWSKSFNMHFGYWKWGLNPFLLETLLDQMNLEVMERLQIKNKVSPVIFDVGCGLATTSRYMAKCLPRAHFYGITITPWQIDFGGKLNQEAGLSDRVSLLKTDFQAMLFPARFADAAFCIESSCYGRGKDKRLLINEVARVLKPGGRWVVADGFRKNNDELPSFLEKIYRKNMECWALDDLAELGPFVEAMKAGGFVNIKVEDASWKVAPSFAHIPFITLKFFLKRLLGLDKTPLTQERKNNAMAPIFGMAMGLSRKHFGYYIISAEKG